MNCKICGNPLSVDDKGYYIEQKNKRHGTCDECWKRVKKEEIEDETSFTKTAFIKVINILQIIGFIIMAIIDWNNEEVLQGFIYVVIGLVIFAFIKGFADIIDLLDNINDKIGN